jgi:site-specific DNA recombinase
MTDARRDSFTEDRARASRLPTNEIVMRSVEDTSDLLAVLYLRVSTKEQAEMGGEAEGFSIPAQREAGRRKAEALGATVVAEFVDRGESARSANRPELQLLLEYVKTNRVDYVIVHKVDRLARNRADDVEINLALQAAGVKLVSVTENIDETPSGMLLHGIMSSIAEFYSRNLANEVIKGSTQKAKTGGTIGKAPVGYVNVRKIIDGREVRTVDVDSERAPLMQWVLEQFATGEWTTRGLLAAATERGLTTFGGPRTPSQSLSLSHFIRLMRSPYYVGIVTYRGVRYQGTHPALISAETFDKVQAALDANRTNGEKLRAHPHYLKSSVRCGSCASRLIVSHNVGRRGRTYEYFICLGRHQKRTGCTRSAMPISLVEDGVAVCYERLQLDDDQINALRQVLVETFTRWETTSGWQLKQFRTRRAVLLREQQKALQAHYAEAISLEVLRVEQQRIESEIALIDRRMASCKIQVGSRQRTIDQALLLLGNFAKAYRLAPPRVRRQMNQALFTALLVDEEGDVRAEPVEALSGPLEVNAVLENQEGPPPWQEAGFWDLDTDDTDGVGGVKADYLVGAEGLEPPTSAL